MRGWRYWRPLKSNILYGICWKVPHFFIVFESHYSSHETFPFRVVETKTLRPSKILNSQTCLYILMKEVTSTGSIKEGRGGNSRQGLGTGRGHHWVQGIFSTWNRFGTIPENTLSSFHVSFDQRSLKYLSTGLSVPVGTLGSLLWKSPEKVSTRMVRCNGRGPRYPTTVFTRILRSDKTSLDLHLKIFNSKTHGNSRFYLL